MLIMGMAGQQDQEAAQHTAVTGTDASLRKGQGNWLALTLASQEIIGGMRDRLSRGPVPYKTQNSVVPDIDVNGGSGSGNRGWKDVGPDAHCALSRKRSHMMTPGRWL